MNKLLSLFFLALVMTAPCWAVSSQSQVSFSSSRMTIREAFSNIEKQSGYTIAYNEAMLNVGQMVNVKSQCTVDEAMTEILAGTGTHHAYQGKIILVVENKQDGNSVYSGIIRDENGPVPGAVIVNKTNNETALSDDQGKFSIRGRSGDVLVVNMLGYKDSQFTLSSQTSNLTIGMEIDKTTLDEVVVVGYGVQKKVNMTGSVSSVNFQSLETQSRPITDASQALSSATPGLQVMQGSGAPNSESFSYNIRGTGTLNSSSPLILVDGMEQSISSVNPADIANVSVLKDAASCAIYGNRGANGVILITTKNGSSDGKIIVSYDATISYNEPLKIIHSVSDYVKYMQLMNESYENARNNPQFPQNTIDLWTNAKQHPDELAASGYPNYVAYPNTDWWNEIYKKQWMQKHSISISGKEKRSGYTMSLGYTKNPGIVRSTGYERFQGRINLYSDVTDWLRVGSRIWGHVTNHDVSYVDGNGDGFFNSLNTTKMLPCTYPYYDGKYGAPEGPEDDPQSHNPLWDAAGLTGYDKYTQLYTDWYARIKFLRHFSYDADLYYRDLRQERKSSDASIGKYSFSKDAYSTGASDPSELYTSMTYTRDKLYKLSHILNYSQTFAQTHDVSAMVGYEEQKYNYRITNANKRGLTDANVNDFNAASTPYSSTGYGTEYGARSVFGRANYAYKSKYLFEANFRYDGSSRFASGHRWGFFPSFSAGWRMSEEPWIKKNEWLSNLKLRASWGKLGNNSIGNYDWQALYSSTNYSFGQSIASGIAVTAINNLSLEWEETAVTNVGVDFGFLSDRLTGTIDVYDKHTSGILYRPDISMIFGNATAPMANIAEVKNNGVEIELGWRDRIGESFNYSVKGNFSFNKNRVSKYKGKLQRGWNDDHTEYSTNIGDVSTGSGTRVLEGHMINEWYLLNVYKGSGKYFGADGKVLPNGGPKDGMIRTENDMKWLQAMQDAGYSFQPKNNIGKNGLWYGEYIYADANGDGIYGNTYDNEFQNCSTQPKYNYGLTFTADWKGIDFSMTWGGSAGFKLYYYETGRNGSETIYGYTIGDKVANNHYFYDPENPQDPRTNITSKQPRLINLSGSQSSAGSALHLEKGDFLKLRNLTIGYTLPQTLTQKAFINRLRVFASGENLLLFTGFSGQDPEMRKTVGYSTMRQFALGVNVTF